MPVLDNVMYNFVGCTNILFGSRSRYCITYKLGLTSISIWRRKYFHSYLAKIDSNSFNDSKGLSVNSQYQYFLTSGKNIQIYDQNSYAK